MAQLEYSLFGRVTDDDGKPISGGFLRVYDQNTTNLSALFSNPALSTPLTNPVEADAAGRLPPIFLAAGTFDLALLDAEGGLVDAFDDFEIEDLSGLGAVSFPVIPLTADHTLDEDEDSTVFEINPDAAPGSSITFTAESGNLGNGFISWIANVGATGTVVLTPGGGETIDGAASRSLAAGEVVGIVSRGASGWRIFTHKLPSGVNGRVLTLVSGKPAWSAAATVAPQGRLTLTSGVPVLTSNATAQGTIYYTPYLGNSIPVFNGTEWVSQTFAELTLVLDAVGHVSGSQYDVVAALDGSTLRIATGPAWSSSTSRGTGAGTTQVSFSNGRYTNTVQVTGRYNSTTFTIAAGAGLYLGSFRASGNGQTTWNPQPAAAAGGGAAQAYLWNMYNRVSVAAWSLDSTNSWAYTTLTWQAANANNNNRISALFGLNEDACSVSANSQASNSSGGPDFYVGIGLDSTSAIVAGSIPGRNITPGGAGDIGFASASFTGLAGLGHHFFQWLEAAEASATTTFYGDNNVPTFVQTGIHALLRM